MKEKILITGGAQFYWKPFSWILSKNFNIVIIDNLSHSNKIKHHNHNIKLVKGNVKFRLSKIPFKKLLNDLSFGCGIRCWYCVKKMLKLWNVNLKKFKNVCHAAKKNNIKKIIYSSSSGVYGKLNYKSNVKESATIAPVSAYSIAKRSCEFYLENFYKKIKLHL